MGQLCREQGFDPQKILRQHRTVVFPQWRGNGIGGALMRVCANLGRRAGLTHSLLITSSAALWHIAKKEGYTLVKQVPFRDIVIDGARPKEKLEGHLDVGYLKL